MTQRPIYGVDIRTWIAAFMVVLGSVLLLWFSLDYELSLRLLIVGTFTVVLVGVLVGALFRQGQEQ